MTPNWHTFGTDENGSNMPTQIELKLPKGFKLIKTHWPEKDLVPGKYGGFEEYYDNDFYVVYTIKAENEISGEQTFKAELNWQCCDPNMCILGEAKLKTKVLIGKRKKNKLFKLIN